MTVNIISRPKRRGYAAYYEVGCPAYDYVLRFPTYKEARNFCLDNGFDIYNEKAKPESRRSKTIIYNTHFASSQIRKSFGEQFTVYRYRKAM